MADCSFRLEQLKKIANNDVEYQLLKAQILFIFYFYLYIYPPDSQEGDGGAIHRVSNYPDLLPEMSRYCCPPVI